MHGLPIEVLVVLGGVGLVALLWLLLRFGRQIARVLFISAILAIGAIVALALLSQGVANYQVARATTQATQAVKVASLGQAVAVLIIGVLVIALLAAVGTAAYFALRYQQAQRKAQTGDWLPGPNALWGRRQLPLSADRQEGPAVYVVEIPPAGAQQPVIWEESEWTTDDWQF